MRLSTLLTILPAVLAAPAKRSEPAPLIVPRGETAQLIADKYIVKFKEHGGLSILDDALGLLTSDADHVFRGAFTGFAGHLDKDTLETLRDHPDVEYIEQDSIASASAVTQQSNAAWGLSRISHRRPGYPNYVYDNSAGQGTCVYVVDSGVDDRHPEFEGRVTRLTSFIDGQDYDDFGHGTHVAGTIGSKTYGVAKKARIYAIKVLDFEGNGPYSSIIAGMNYVAQDVPRRNCPNGIIVNMSLGGPYSEAANNAAAALVRRGYFVAVAAGNSNDNAQNYSPGSEPSVCTVGGTAKDDTRYNMSNWGPLVDILGPAVDIYSTFPSSRYGFLTGTSMATPHIAGLAAYLASSQGRRAGPSLCQEIQRLATRNAITNQTPNTVNLLAFNGNPSG